MKAASAAIKDRAFVPTCSEKSRGLMGTQNFDRGAPGLPLLHPLGECSHRRVRMRRLNPAGLASLTLDGVFTN
jgi:hypothetical protein